ncbi:MAG: hypothetical protein LBP59_04905 [Planctomycetaceae bacterium]|nr:hypothetical protein [Planctomycetaceae bacterium]
MSITGQIFIVTKNAGMQASRLCSFRFAGIRLVFRQMRRRNACIPGSRASRLHAVVLNRW